MTDDTDAGRARRSGRRARERIRQTRSSPNDGPPLTIHRPQSKEPTCPPSPRPRRAPVKVTFTWPTAVDTDEVALCGDFNNWITDDIKLGRDPNGLWRTTVSLESGRTYRYRCLVDGQRWENAWDADDYLPNPTAETTRWSWSTIDLRGGTFAAPRVGATGPVHRR